MVRSTKQLRIYFAAFLALFAVLIFFTFQRLFYLNAQSAHITVLYNYLTGILPATLVEYFGLDMLFFLTYVKERGNGKNIRKLLSAWMVLTMLPLSFTLPAVWNSMEENMLIYAAGTFIPLIVSLIIPVYLMIETKE